MKKLMIFCLLLGLTVDAAAQRNSELFKDTDEVETLFNKVRIVGAFGGPFFEYSKLGGDLQVASGGDGALIINDLFIGLYGMDARSRDFTNSQYDEIRMKHGGLWLGYTYRPKKLLHLYGSAKLGMGELDIRFNDNPNFEDEIFVMTPELGVEVNIFRFFKLGLTGGYRFVDGYSEPANGFKKDDLNGPVGSITLRFGWFGHNRRWW